MRLTVLALALAAIPLAACNDHGFGSNFEGEVTMRTTRANAPPTDMVIKAKGDKLRLEMPTPDGKTATAIYTAQASSMLVLIDDQKIAMDMDLSSPSAPTANTDAKTSAVTQTGKKETIAGITCEDFEVKDPSGSRTETCVAEGLPFLDLEALRHGGGGSSWARDMRAKRTFPLRSVEYDAAGKELTRSEVTAVKKMKIDDALFQVPADYKHLSPPPPPPIVHPPLAAPQRPPGSQR